MHHEEIQTCSSIITIGSVAIIVATFLTGNEFIESIPWQLNPITLFFIGGLLLIISGCFLLLYYTRENKLALIYSNVFFSVGLSLIIIAGFLTITMYILSKSYFI